MGEGCHASHQPSDANTTSERFCDDDLLRRGAISSVWTFTFLRVIERSTSVKCLLSFQTLYSLIFRNLLTFLKLYEGISKTELPRYVFHVAHTIDNGVCGLPVFDFPLCFHTPLTERCAFHRLVHLLVWDGFVFVTVIIVDDSKVLTFDRSLIIIAVLRGILFVGCSSSSHFDL